MPFPIDTCRALTGIGGYQRRMVVEWAVRNGAHVRTGLEDSLYLDREKRVFAKNEDLVRTARELAESTGRDVATPEEARDLVGLWPAARRRSE